MNKAELVKVVSERSDLTQRSVELVISHCLETVVDAVAKGDKVTLVGFGTFERVIRKARKGRDMISGTDIDIPSKSVPKFRAGKLFKELVRQ